MLLTAATHICRRTTRFVGLGMTKMIRISLHGPAIAGVAIWILSQASAVLGQGDKNAEAMRFFENKIRPILAEHCYRCHGPEKHKGDLRVDSRSALLTGGELGPAIVAGDAEKSLLVKAVRQSDPDLKMPPTGKLTKEQIEDIARWVNIGAPWPGSEKEPVKTVKKTDREITDKDREHWAFQPIRRPAVPKVVNPHWVANPIDAFIAAKLETKSLKPNPPATKSELIRRLTYNITGLPPTPAEVDAFVKNTSPRAYDELVERLLSSPRYGEKWARHWLDIVRYAETNSYERDNPKPHVWRYRDYVIRSLNEDKPYDVFLCEQLAGDEMPNPGPDQLIATGFYRLGIWDDEPSDPALARFDGLDDIVATVGQGILGLTLDCARCHDHKIDPIPQKDYYRFLSFFSNINHFRNGGPTDETAIYTSPKAKTALDSELARLKKRRDDVQSQIAAIEADFAAAGGNKGTIPPQSPIVDLKYRFFRDTYETLPVFDTIKHEEAGSLPKGFFDLAPRTRNEAFGFVYEGTLVVPKVGKYTFVLDSDDGVRLTVGDRPIITYDGIHGVGKERSVAVDLPKGPTPIRLDYFQNGGGYGLYVAWSGPGFERQYLSVPPSGANSSGDFQSAFQKQGAQVLGPKRFKEYQALKKELETLKNPMQAAGAERALIVTEAGRNPKETFVLTRGNPGAPGAKVDPTFPTVLNARSPQVAELPANVKSSGRRTALANWITSRDNQLTARVMVNRVWQHHFGRGIVRSPNNFGLQGDRPTHPELLDWLASELIDSGWNLKHIHRLIINSNAYKMSSRGESEALRTDPTNDYFWRFDMRRLAAEEIRDSVLATCGNLNLKMYGPGIYPEIPKEVLAGQSVPGRGWGKSPPEEQARRSIYVHVKRSLLLPILDSFDLAETDRSAPTRFASTQPTQALLMLNSEFINKQADIFAERLRREAGDDLTAQVKLGLNLATSRTPTDAEVRRGVDLVTTLAREEGASQAAALRYFCLMVLNLNEFMYLD
jgi:mono/diheme cytochrome c family protein